MNPAQEMSDPREDLAITLEAVSSLLENVDAADLANETPCSEFLVGDLLDHMVMVARRIALIGYGEDFSQAEQEKLGADWLTAWQEAVTQIAPAWQEDEKLAQEFVVPWGKTPGAPTLWTYVCELAIHGRDLAIATNQDFAVEDVALQGAFVSAKFIPAEGRQDPAMPFDPVVEVAETESVLEQMAGWLGRKPLVV